MPETKQGCKIRTSPSGFASSEIGFGTWQFGSSGRDDYWGLEYTQEMASRMVQLAVDAGITYFDTAEVYSAGASETQLGVALKTLDSKARSKVVIGSKILPNNCNDVKAHCLATLERLQLDCIDLYMVHWPIDNKSISVSATFQALKALQDAGKIKYIGVSNFGVAQMTEALETKVQIAVNQICYNVLFRAAEYEIIPFCEQHGIGVLAYSPLMQGLLTGRWSNADQLPIPRARSRHFRGDRPKSRHGESGHEKLLFETLARLQKIAADAGVTLTELALAWPLRMSASVISVIAGATREAHITGNVNGAAKASLLTDSVMAAIDSASDDLKTAMGSNCDMWQGGNLGRIK